MRILELLDGKISNGGIEMFLLNLIKRIDLSGNDALIDCMTVEHADNEALRSLVEGRGGRIYSLGLNLYATKFSNHIYKPVLSFLKEHNYDIIHIHASSISAIALLAAAADKAGAKKVIVHSHATGRYDNITHKAFRMLAGFPLSGHADVFCACSKKAAEWKFSSKNASKAVIVKNGIDTKRFKYNPEVREEVRASLKIDSSALVIGNVGRFCPEKNHGFLLEIFEVLHKKQSDSVLFLLGDGEDKEKIRESVRAKGLEKSVIFTGNVTNVEDYMQAMDVFAFPSLFEGLGIVAVEAQCSGLPVAASDGVPKDICITEKVSFLSLSQSAEVWADELIRLGDYERADQSEIIKNAGYDIEATVRQIEKIYFS